MRISKIKSGKNSTAKAYISKDFIPTTVRHNSLSDMDFNIIADTIKYQTLINQMNVRLLNLTCNLNNCIL
ncbi:MAG: hypothetical protein LUH11_00395 [Candidatus Gastranaerophilales bacterium]|nr:hypothetical protein [Candidatus Gastranaerophilales bacterium]